MPTVVRMNSVEFLQASPFYNLALEKQLEIKKLGRPKLPLNIVQTVKTKNRQFNRNFNSDLYEKHNWLCGCDITNALYCFPCLLFVGEQTWTHTGVTDLQHIGDKIKKHEASRTHIKNVVNLALLGEENESQEVDSEERKRIVLHNEQVKQNRYILNIIINCIRFCGAFELALQERDESDVSNPGIFRGLINFSTELDMSMRSQLERSGLLQDESQGVQSKLLDIILNTCQDEIMREIQKANYLSVIIDETGDVSDKFQMALIFRYLVDGRPVERFWTFLTPEKRDIKSLFYCVMSELEKLEIKENKYKLISQTYDGPALLSNSFGGMQSLLKMVCPKAEYIHCHGHQLNTVVLNAASMKRNVRVFVANLNGICNFFSRRGVVDDFVRRLWPCSADWGLISERVTTLYKCKEEIVKCLNMILTDSGITNNEIISLASCYLKVLNCSKFLFWLSLFYKIIVQVDLLSDKVLIGFVDMAFVKQCLDSFDIAIIRIKSMELKHILPVPLIEDPLLPKRMKTDYSELAEEARQVCDIISIQVKQRFQFTSHLIAASLLLPSYFPKYDDEFPTEAFTETCRVYNFLNFQKFKTELSVVYNTRKFRSLDGAVNMLQFINESDLAPSLTETVKLLKALLTIPMSTTEDERCFPTLQRIRTFLRNTVADKGLSALGMLSVERNFILGIPNFNEKVMDKFAQLEEHRDEFSFK